MKKILVAIICLFCLFETSCSKAGIIKSAAKGTKNVLKGASSFAHNRKARQEILKNVHASSEKNCLSYARKKALDAQAVRNPIKRGSTFMQISLKKGLTNKINKADCNIEHRNVAIKRITNIKNPINLKAADYAYSQVGKIQGFPISKYNQLLGYLDPAGKNYNPYLVERITKEGNIAIVKWLNSHHKNAKLISGLPKINNKKILNSSYANNTYFFDPAYNDKMRNVLSQKGTFNGYTQEQIINFNLKYPNGVKFRSTGYPDFSQYVPFDKKGKPCIVNVGKLQSSREKDFTIARDVLKNRGYTNEEIKQLESTHTWHHIENSTKLELVPRDLHDMVAHTGGRATMGFAD